MGVRNNGWHEVVLAAACAAVAGMPAGARAQYLRLPDAPAVTTGSVAGMAPSTPGRPRLVWGGPVPDLPAQAYAPADARPPQPMPRTTAPGDAAPLPAQAAFAPTAAPSARLAPADDGLPDEASDTEELPDGALNLADLPPPVSIEDLMVKEGADDGLPAVDPWDGMKAVTPGALPPRRSFASLLPSSRPERLGDPVRRQRDFDEDLPGGYAALPRGEAMCRRALADLGVAYVDAASISRSRSCGIDYPVKVTQIAPGVAMQPAATLNCETALRAARWMHDAVKPAARSNLWSSPVAVLNASSYRCSRIAGSRTISEHASGNALDVRGFKLSDGSVMEIEKKGFFSVREKGFQKSVRSAACRYFGTVLGPGYNRDHADHLHLDAKQRRRGVCK